MAGRGPAPKRADLRQRTNRHASKASLPSAEDAARNDVPDMPPREGDWHPMVVEWWVSVWRSPMASAYLEADKRGLYRLVMLEQDFWEATTAAARRSISVEIRNASLAFGLNPIDRNRLQWQAPAQKPADEAAPASRAISRPDRPVKDARAALRLA